MHITSHLKAWFRIAVKATIILSVLHTSACQHDTQELGIKRGPLEKLRRIACGKKLPAVSKRVLSRPLLRPWPDSILGSWRDCRDIAMQMRRPYSQERDDKGEQARTILDISGIAKMIEEADGYCDRGIPQKFTPLYKEVLAFYRREFPTLVEHDHLDTAEDLTHLDNLGKVHRRLSMPGIALQYYERAFNISKRHFGEKSRETAAALKNLALAYDYASKPEEAVKYYGQALNIQEEYLDDDSLKVAETCNGLGEAYYNLGRESREFAIPIFDSGASYDRARGRAREFYQEALKCHERALGIRRAHLDENSLEVAKTLYNLAKTYQALGETQKVLPLHKQVLTIRQSRLDKNHPDVAWSLYSLAEIYKTSGKPEEALVLYKALLDNLVSRLEERHLYIVLTLDNLMLIYTGLGMLDEAEATIKNYESRFGNKAFLEIAERFHMLAQCCSDLKRQEQALRLYQKVLAIRQEFFGDHAPQVVEILKAIADTHLELGNIQEAIRMYKRVSDAEDTKHGR